MPVVASASTPGSIPHWPARALWLLIVLTIAFFVAVAYLNSAHYGLKHYERITGRIVSPIEDHQRLRVVLWRRQNSRITVESIATPNASGIFAFLVRPGAGEVRIWVHDDENENQRFDRGESSASGNVGAMSSHRGAMTGAGTARLLELSLSRDDANVAQIETVDAQLSRWRSRRVGSLTGTSAIPIGFGEVVDLDDVRLARATGVSGLWRPAAVVRNSGLGVYFLERYDPTRQPLVLVHGAAGSAMDFKPLMDELGRRHWQFWLFSYPSGIELSVAAEALERIVTGLADSHGVASLSVVAHSMGGLVARAALLRMQRHDTPLNVSGFVSVATPWRGHPAARWGVRHSPVSLPSWRDMLPDSVFIKNLASASLSSPHLLIYGEKSTRRFYLPKRNDGTIGVDSATHQPIVDAAVDAVRFELDHVAIIQSATVVEQIERFLRQTAQNAISH